MKGLTVSTTIINHNSRKKALNTNCGRRTNLTRRNRAKHTNTYPNSRKIVPINTRQSSNRSVTGRTVRKGIKTRPTQNVRVIMVIGTINALQVAPGYAAQHSIDLLHEDERIEFTA